jgi:transcriptional regulator with XRE-family HTH domain
MPRFDRLGQVLRLLREERGWSQREMARAAGLSTSQLSSYETGVKQPSIESLGKLLDALGLRLGKLDAALDLVNGRPWGGGSGRQAPGPPRGEDLRVELGRFLGVEGELPPRLVEAFGELYLGFRRIARGLHRAVAKTLAGDGTE